MADNIIEINDLTIRFNLATEKIDNLKEHFVKLIKRQLLFQEFLAIDDFSLNIKKGEAWRVDSPALSGRGSRPSGRTSG